MNSNQKTNFLKKIKNSFSNVANTSKNNQGNQGFDIGSIFKIFIGIILFGIILYILMKTYYYYSTTECSKGGEKKTFWEYISDIYGNEVCDTSKKALTKDFKLSEIQMPLEKEEVYHIANQDYTYDQAKCKCESYGGRLATRDEVVNSYNQGASWCTYGWSKGQMAYYPVQQCDYDKMMEDNKDKPPHLQQHCGKPGMNGGYFSNPYIKFGVNCYGVKPKGSAVIEKKPYCPPQNFCKMEKNFQASHKLDTDQIMPFSPGRWNQA
jgi:hypothetical protein